MKNHQLHCQDPWFSLIRQGKKPVEGRKNLPKFKDWKNGDRVTFVQGKESFDTKIISLKRYKTLKDYLYTETLARALPGITTLAEGINIYLQWSTREEIAQYGFLAIEIELV